MVGFRMVKSPVLKGSAEVVVVAVVVSAILPVMMPRIETTEFVCFPKPV